MKKLFAMLIVVMITILTGCGSTATPVRKISEDVTYYELYSPNPDYNMCERSDEAEKIFEAVCEAEMLILNDAYNLNLKREKVEVFFTPNIQKAIYGHEEEGVNGYYSFELNQVFLEEHLKDNMPKLMGVIAHEAIHYLYAINNNTDSFFTYKNCDGDKELGDALIEGLTQRIALNNLHVLEKYGYCQGAYDEVINNYYFLTRITDLLCNYAVKDMEKYYLSNDFDSARKAFNSSVGNISSTHEPFELFENALGNFSTICYYDDSYIDSDEIAMKNLEDAVWLITLAVKNSSEDNKKAFLSEFDSLGFFNENYVKNVHRLLE